MFGGYKVTTLEAGDVHRAYAIIAHLHHAPTFEEWQAATRTELQRRKWITAVDAAGVVRGLCYVFVRHDLELRNLEVPLFAIVGLVDEKEIARELLEAAQKRAIQMDCDVIHFWPAALREWSADFSALMPDRTRRGLIYDLRASGVPSP